MNRIKALIPVPILIVLLLACAQLEKNNPQDMSPKEVAIWANRQYEQQYKAYLQDYELGKNNQYMREMLVKKREILIAVYPNLLTFNELVSLGETPPQQMTDNIIRLIYQLTGVY